MEPGRCVGGGVFGTLLSPEASAVGRVSLGLLSGCRRVGVGGWVGGLVSCELDSGREHLVMLPVVGGRGCCDIAIGGVPPLCVVCWWGCAAVCLVFVVFVECLCDKL